MSVETSTDNHTALFRNSVNIFDFQSSEQQNGVSTVYTVDTRQYRSVQIK